MESSVEVKIRVSSAPLLMTLLIQKEQSVLSRKWNEEFRNSDASQDFTTLKTFQTLKQGAIYIVRARNILDARAQLIEMVSATFSISSLLNSSV